MLKYKLLLWMCSTFCKKYSELYFYFEHILKLKLKYLNICLAQDRIDN